MFEIAIDVSHVTEAADDRSGQAVGRIVIGSFSESFAIPLGYWSSDEYRRSWCSALKLLETDEMAVSCLAVSMSDPANTNFIFCWPLYREGNVVHVQNSVLFLDEVESFDPQAPWLSINPRVTVNEDGDFISEWDTDMESIRSARRSVCQGWT